MNKVTQVVEANIPRSAEARNNRRKHIYRPLAIIAIASSATLVGLGIGEGLQAIDKTTQTTTASVTETMPNGGNDIQLAKQAVIDLGLSPNDYSPTDIGQGVNAPANEQPGEAVKFDKVHHWYGIDTVEGSVVDNNK